MLEFKNKFYQFNQTTYVYTNIKLCQFQLLL